MHLYLKKKKRRKRKKRGWGESDDYMSYICLNKYFTIVFKIMNVNFQEEKKLRT